MNLKPFSQPQTEPLGYIISGGRESNQVDFVNLGSDPPGTTCPEMLPDTPLALDAAMPIRSKPNDGFMLCGGTDLSTGPSPIQHGIQCLHYMKNESRWLEFPRVMSTAHRAGAATWLPPRGDHLIRGGILGSRNDDRFDVRMQEFEAITP